MFVSSRRQTRLTALDLIAYCATEVAYFVLKFVFTHSQDNPKQFVHMDEGELDALLTSVKDPNLRLTLSFGRQRLT